MENNFVAEDIKDLRVSIIGLGLIGGSLARALRERLGIKDIVAVNRSSEALEQALRDGNILQGFHDLNEYVYKSDIIFICTPVRKTMEFIDRLAGKIKPGCIVTDVGSTKSELAAYVNAMDNPPCFVGGHPMAGTEKTGYSAGFAHLFENAYYVLAPGRSATDGALGLMTDLVKGIGAIPVVMDSEEHDRATGGISHVPHVIAAALVNLVKETDSSVGTMQLLAAGGFRDITRIASSSPEMWENIVLSNRHHMKELLGMFTEILDKFQRSMEAGDSQALLDFFNSARAYRDSMPLSKKGLIAPIYEIIADVVDKPGIIGEIATILGENNINIKNINVTNNREFEQGCLKITLADPESVKIAFDLLEGSGYKVYRNI